MPYEGTIISPKGVEYPVSFDNEPTQEDLDFVIQRIAQRESDTGQNLTSSAANAAVQGGLGLLPSAIQGAGAILPGDFGKDVRGYGKTMAGDLAETFPVNPVYEESPAVKIAGSAGQGVAQLGIALASGGSTVPSLLTAGLAGVAGGADIADAYGLEGWRRNLLEFGTGAIEVGTESLTGIGSSRFLKGAGRPLVEGVKAVAGETGEELLAGTGTDILTNIALAGTGKEGVSPFNLSRRAEDLYSIAGAIPFGGVAAYQANRLRGAKLYARVDGQMTPLPDDITDKTVKTMGLRPEDIAVVPGDKVAELEQAILRARTEGQAQNVQSVITGAATTPSIFDAPPPTPEEIAALDEMPEEEDTLSPGPGEPPLGGGVDVPAPAATPEETDNQLIAGSFQKMGSAITDNLYKGLYDALVQGKTTFSGVKDPVLVRARPAFDAGLIQSPDDLRKFEDEGYPILPETTNPAVEGSAPGGVGDLGGTVLGPATGSSAPAVSDEQIPGDTPQVNTEVTAPELLPFENFEAQLREQTTAAATVRKQAAKDAVNALIAAGEVEQNGNRVRGLTERGRAAVSNMVAAAAQSGVPTNARTLYQQTIKKAFAEKKPVSAWGLNQLQQEADQTAAALGFPPVQLLPPGYVQEGDRFVFKPTTVEDLATSTVTAKRNVDPAAFRAQQKAVKAKEDAAAQPYPEVGRPPLAQDIVEMALDPNIQSAEDLGGWEAAWPQVMAEREKLGGVRPAPANEQGGIRERINEIVAGTYVPKGIRPGTETISLGGKWFPKGHVYGPHAYIKTARLKNGKWTSTASVMSSVSGAGGPYTGEFDTEQEAVQDKLDTLERHIRSALDKQSLPAPSKKDVDNLNKVLSQIASLRPPKITPLSPEARARVQKAVKAKEDAAAKPELKKTGSYRNRTNYSYGDYRIVVERVSKWDRTSQKTRTSNVIWVDGVVSSYSSVKDAVAGIDKQQQKQKQILAGEDTATPQPEAVQEEPEVTPALKAEEKKSEKIKQSTPPDNTTLKDQKKYLLEQIDVAIKEAPTAADAAYETEAGEDLKQYNASIPHFLSGETQAKYNARRTVELAGLFVKYGVPLGQPAGSDVASPGAKLQLEAAMEEAKMRQTPRVTIEVPGDGTFRIINTKEALSEFKKRAAKFPTSVPKPQAPTSVPMSDTSKVPPIKNPKTLEEKAAAISTVVSTSDEDWRRPVTLIRDTGEELVATDGKRLIRVEADSPARSPGWFNDKGKKVPTPKDIKGEELSFPKFEQVIPPKKNRALIFKGLDTARLFTVLSQAQAALKGNPKTFYYRNVPVVRIFKNPDDTIGFETFHAPQPGMDVKDEGIAGYEHNMQEGAELVAGYDVDFLLDLVGAARALGHEKLNFHIGDQNVVPTKKDWSTNPAVLEAPGLEMVLMSVRAENEITAPIQRIEAAMVKADGPRSAAQLTPPANPIPVGMAAAHLARVHGLGKGQVEVVSRPDMPARGWLNVRTGKPVINAPWIKNADEVSEVLYHEITHRAEEDPAMRPDIDAFMATLTPAEVNRFNDRIARMEYEINEFPTERAAMAISEAANRFRGRSTWGKLVQRVKTWWKGLTGQTLNRRDAEAVAARIVARAIAQLKGGRPMVQGRVSGNVRRSGVESGLWDTPTQEITSADTSINSGKTAATFTKVVFEPNTTNVDIGGGRFDNATELLAKRGVRNLIFDPYNRSAQHNASVVSIVRDGGADTATVNNVLNVIREAPNREKVIKQAANAIKDNGKAYFLIYEGNGSGVGKATSKGWQENRKTKEYLAEIEKHFGKVRVSNGVIVAENPLKGDTKFSKPESTFPSDAEYLAAVERGDMETAQRMVDEAAKAAGYNDIVYHGSPNKKITKFLIELLGGNTRSFGADIGFFVSSRKDIADSDHYVGRKYEGNYPNEKIKSEGKVYRLYVKSKNPYLARSGDQLEAILARDLKDFFGGKHPSGKEIRDWLLFNGYDSVRYKDAPSMGDFSASESILLNPEQIKSADPVTRDEQGKLIPLSERFNPANDDIRFSKAESALPADTEVTLTANTSRGPVEITMDARDAEAMLTKRQTVLQALLDCLNS